MKYGKFYITEEQFKNIFNLNKETIITHLELNPINGEIEFITKSSTLDNKDVWGDCESGREIRRTTFNVGEFTLQGVKVVCVENN